MATKHLHSKQAAHTTPTTPTRANATDDLSQHAAYQLMLQGEDLKDVNVSYLLNVQKNNDPQRPKIGVLFTAYHPDPNKPLKRTVLFGCSRYTITNSDDKEYPKQFDPALFPLRQVIAPANALTNPNMTIDVKDLELFTAADLCRIYDNESIESFAPVGYGKIIRDSSRGKMAAIYNLSYDRGPDCRDTYWSKVRTGKDKKELLIPISYLNYSKTYPTLDNTSLPVGTTISFNYGFEVTTGKNFACNIRIVALLNSRNMFGSPACRLQSKVVMQPNGHNVDIHVHEHELIIHDEYNKLLCSHVEKAVAGASWKVHVYFRAADADGLNEVSIIQLGRYLQQQYNIHWFDANLDQMVEAYVGIKRNTPLIEAYNSKKLAVTFIYSLTNQNYLQLATQQIHNSFNLYGQNGHTHLNAHTGVAVVFRPEAHSVSGSISQVNHLGLLSKAACAALGKTYTYKPGYTIDYSHGGNKRGKTHAFISLAVFGESAKTQPLVEEPLQQDPSESPAFTPPFTLIKVQYIPGTASAHHPLHTTINSDDFKKITEKYNYGTYEPSKKFKYRTVIISAKPGHTKTVIAKLRSHKGVLVMPEDCLDNPGALLRSRVPFPKDAEEIVNAEEIRFAQWLNKYTLRLIFQPGYGPETLPKLLKMQTSAAHTEDYLSLVAQNNTVWSEVTTNSSNTILGRTPTLISSSDPCSVFWAGFRGITPSAWIENNILRPNLGDTLIVDTKEETAQGGIFIQHLKPSRAGAIGPSGAETVLCLYTTNQDTLEKVKELSNHISYLSNSTIYPITDGLQYLTLRADALSVESEELQDAAALAEFENSIQHPPSYPSTHNALDLSTSPDDSPWVDAPVTRNTRSKQAQANQPKPIAPPPQKKDYRPVLASVISDDDEEDEPASLPTNERTPDKGDFNVSDDKAITGYFKSNLKDSNITDKQKEQLVQKAVLIWATAFPNYHKAKLGTNFTGNNKFGRLIANALNHDTSLIKGLFKRLDKHSSNPNSSIKELELDIGEMIKTQQSQKDNAAANKANRKAAKANSTTPTTGSSTPATTSPASTQAPKTKNNALSNFFSRQPSSSTTPTTTTNSPLSNDSNIASSSNTSSASSSNNSSASSGGGGGDGSSSSSSSSSSGSDASANGAATTSYDNNPNQNDNSFANNNNIGSEGSPPTVHFHDDDNGDDGSMDTGGDTVL